MCPKVFVLIIFIFGVHLVPVLSSSTYPISYDLWIDATQSWVKENYDGRVEIIIGVTEPTNQINLDSDFVFMVVHSRELYEIQDSKHVKIALKNNVTQAYEKSSDRQLIEIEGDDFMLEVGKEYLVIAYFTSYFDGAAKGVYFIGEDFYDHEFAIVATNFFPNYAHQAFPCYDNPSYKVTIKLTIVHGVKYNAVSNMPIENLSTDNDLKATTTTFLTTPLLSVHSFGFVISEFKNTVVNKNVKYVAYYDDKHDTSDVELVIDAEDKMLMALQRYLNANVGALEIKEVPQYDDNTYYPKIGTYGLILNDYQYYYCESSATLFQREEITRRTARLMANQFFSNLISPNAWEDAWITQGISVLLEYSLLETDFAHLKSMDSFLVRLYKFMGSKRMYYTLQGAEMTRYLFDRSYEVKAAEFMFMLKNVLTEDIFRQFLQKLVVDYRNVPISTAQFLDMLTSFAKANRVLPPNYNFATILDTWLIDPGVPVIHVTRDYETGKVTLAAHNLFDWGASGLSWWVPYNYVIEHSDSDWSTAPKGWIESTPTLELNLSDQLNSDEWILFNVKQSGYYHTIYDHQNWLLLASQLSSDHEQIHYINRGHLVSDAFYFGYDKLITLDAAFASASYLNKEENTFPFRLLFTDEFYAVDSNLFATDLYTNYTIFMRHQMENIYKRIRVIRPAEELEFDEISIRNPVTSFACRIRLQECLEDAKQIFDKYYRDPKQIESDYESDLGYTLMMYGFVLSNETIFWEVFNWVNDGENEETYYTDMIGMTGDPVLMQHLVEILKTPNDETYNDIKINLGAYVRLIIYRTLVNNNIEILDTIYKVLEDESDLIIDLYGYHDKTYWVSYLCARATTEDRLNRIIAFAPKYGHEHEDFSNDIRKAQVIVDWNTQRSVEFNERLANFVANMMNEQDSGSATSLTVSILSILVSPIIMAFTIKWNM